MRRILCPPPAHCSAPGALTTLHIALAWCMLAAAPTALPAQSHDTLAVGTYAYGTVDRRAAVSPLAEYLGNALQRPVRVVVAPDPVALADSVQRERVDVVVTNTFGYLLLADAVPQRAVAVSVFHVPPGVRTHYSAVLVC